MLTDTDESSEYETDSTEDDEMLVDPLQDENDSKAIEDETAGTEDDEMLLNPVAVENDSKPIEDETDANGNGDEGKIYYILIIYSNFY